MNAIVSLQALGRFVLALGSLDIGSCSEGMGVVRGLAVALFVVFFFFNDTAPTEIYTLSLHDALPIPPARGRRARWRRCARAPPPRRDRKSTRLNSSHVEISYAVFCLKKKKKNRD